MTTAHNRQLAIGNRQSSDMARQLSEQYQRAVGGLWEVVKFGAMMMHLQNALFPELIGTGNAKKFASDGDGLKGWLSDNCSEINLKTAYRFKGLAEGLQKEFKLGEPADLHRLLTADASDLNRADLKTREEIAGFLEGQSQRQLQFRFMADKPAGGKRGPVKPITRSIAEDILVNLRSACEEFLRMRSHLNHDQRDAAETRLRETLEEATGIAWRPDAEKERAGK